MLCVLPHLISVPFQNNINFPIGEFSRIQDVLNIQPVIPFQVSEDWGRLHGFRTVLSFTALVVFLVARSRRIVMACATPAGSAFEVIHPGGAFRL